MYIYLFLKTQFVNGDEIILKAPDSKWKWDHTSLDFHIGLLCILYLVGTLLGWRPPRCLSWELSLASEGGRDEDQQNYTKIKSFNNSYGKWLICLGGSLNKDSGCKLLIFLCHFTTLKEAGNQLTYMPILDVKIMWTQDGRRLRGYWDARMNVRVKN